MNNPINYITIMHISDLHRMHEKPEEYVSNNVLLNSLERDSQKYLEEEAVKIPLPSLIIVSGDIVKGVTGKDDQDLLELKRQYDEASSFLEELAKTFLDGDKNKIIIVPGNHDVSWFHSKKSMKPIASACGTGIDEKLKKELCRQLMQCSMNVRWSWDTFSFNKIEDRIVYNQRFEPFAEFYTKFYDGNRSYSLEPTEQYDIFDYPELNITFAAFNSCYGNDHSNRIGKINPECVAQASRKLRDPLYRNRLLISVWHHNTKGLPIQTDYMDVRTLQSLIDSGFSIGMHGHQHKTEVIDEQFKSAFNKKIVVLSAGSLCAGHEELPTGNGRGYNLVQISETSNQLRIHVREMMESAFDYPIWKAGKIEQVGNSYADISIYRPDMHKPESDYNSSNVKMLAEAEELIRNKDYEKAISILETLSFSDLFVRKFLLECYIHLNKSYEIVKRYIEPQNTTEILCLIYSLWETKDLQKLKEFLQSDFVKNSRDPSVKDAYSKYMRRV